MTRLRVSLLYFFFFLLKWQYKQNRRRHLHNLGILWIDKALSCQPKTVAWQYLWWKAVPGYKEREFSLIKDFQDSKHHPLQGKRISAAISEHSLITVWIQLSGERQGISLSGYQHTYMHKCTTDFREYRVKERTAELGQGGPWGLKGKEAEPFQQLSDWLPAEGVTMASKKRSVVQEQNCI